MVEDVGNLGRGRGRRRGKLTEAQIANAYEIADHIIAMLTNLIKVQEARA